MKFKKIASILASAVMLSSTIGFAAAAAYPEPFVSGGTADGAVVVGASADVSDWSAAINIQNNLNGLVSSTTASGSTVSGGDNVQIDKSSTKFQIGRGAKDVVSTAITDDSPGAGLPTLLADGKYIDDDNDEFDFTQKIDLANWSLGMFEDNDYKDDEPTLGVRIASGSNVLNYTLEFTDIPLWADLPTSDITLMGKDYFVLSVTANTTLNLLDSATSTSLAEGETTTINVDGTDYEVSVNFISSTPKVKLEINGQITNSLAATETQKLSDGSYVGIKSIDYTSKDTGISQVEFSIGTGKLKLLSGSDVELNDESINNLGVTLTNSAQTGGDGLQKVMISWDADEDLFVAEDAAPEMPGFGAVKVSMAGMVYGAEEMIEVKPSSSTTLTLEDFPLKDSVEDIDILYGNTTTIQGVGKESGNELITSNVTTIKFDADTDDAFIASWADSNDGESYLMRFTNFKTESSVNKTTLQYKKDGTWTDVKTDGQDGDVVSIGNLELTLDIVEKTAKWVNLTAGTNVNFNTLYSKEGLKVWLPYTNKTADWAAERGSTINTSTAGNPTTFQLEFQEEDRNENVASGGLFNLTIAYSSAEIEANTITGEGTAEKEIQETDVYRTFMYTALGSELLHSNPSSGQDSVKIIYHGDESYAEIFITAPDAVVTPGTTGGEGGQIMVVKDSEVSSVSGKNLVVVGGSCINTVAAKILGSDTKLCTEAFTTATGVGAGQYLIKTVASPYAAADSGKVAMLVAGYDAADTVNAVNKALEGAMSDVDTEQVYPITTA